MAYMGGTALSASEPNSKLLAGQVIGGKYRLSHLLGEGGMASVWAGANERTGKLVALKFIRPTFMAVPGAEAFLQSEALAASRVNHPNVVTVFDAIDHEGKACIVMELLNGVPLGTHIASSGQLSLRDTLTLLLPAMRGVAAAHAQGVIHRDLKPQNIFVCVGPDGRIVTTKVLDFGISTMMDWARGTSTSVVPGLAGTPAYMAPEQIEGSDSLDPRTDVYGFGLLLYEALTGRMAFTGESESEVLRRVVTESAVPLRELRPDLPIRIVSIVETAMSKSPDQRFASLDHMLSVIEDEIMPATPPPVVGTPAAGVPTGAMSYTVSGPLALAVPAFIGREPSEQHHLGTQIFGNPLKREWEQEVSVSEIVDASGRRLEHGVVAPLPTAASGSSGAVPVDSSLSGPSTALRALGATWTVVRALRDWRVLAGAGIALAFVAGTWLTMRGSTRAKQPAPTPAAPLATSPSPANLPPPAPPAPMAAESASPEGEPPTVPSESPPLPTANLGFDDGGNSGEATDHASDSVAVGRKAQSVQSAFLRKKLVAPRVQTPKRNSPRAGTLRVDDF